MEKLILNLKKASINIFGINLSDESGKTFLQVLKSFIPFMLICCHNTFCIQNWIKGRNLSFERNLLFFCMIIIAIVVKFIYARFYRNIKQYKAVLDWVSDRYKTRDFKLADDAAKIEFPKCVTMTCKVVRYILVGHIISFIGMAFGPIVANNYDFPTPIVIPGTNFSTTAGFSLNLSFRFILISSTFASNAFYVIVFALLVLHLLAEMKVLHSVLENVGEYEEKKFLNDCRLALEPLSEEELDEPKKEEVSKNPLELDLEILHKICDELDDENAGISRTKILKAGTSKAETSKARNLKAGKSKAEISKAGPSKAEKPLKDEAQELDLGLLREIYDELSNEVVEKAETSKAEESMNEAEVENFDEIRDFLYEDNIGRNSSVDSATIMREMVVMHNDIISIINQMTAMYSPTIFCYEGLMVVEQALFVLFFFKDRSAAILFLVTMILYTLQYLIVSYISAEIEEAYDDIRTKAYCSKWYWLSPKDRKTLLQMTTMATKTKTLRVGFLGPSNLERFVTAIHFSYDFSMLVKYFMGKRKM